MIYTVNRIQVYHNNKQINDKFNLLYEDIVPLEYKKIFIKM